MLLVAAALASILTVAPAPAPAEREALKVGLPGKDVIWVPTPDAILDRMLAMAQVQKTDLVVDLGAGDGRMVIAAARKYGARGRGIEYNPTLIAAGNRAARGLFRLSGGKLAVCPGNRMRM